MMLITLPNMAGDVCTCVPTLRASCTGNFCFSTSSDRRQEALVDGDVGALRVLEPPLIGIGVAAVGERQAVPFEDEAHRAIERVDCRDASEW